MSIIQSSKLGGQLNSGRGARAAGALARGKSTVREGRAVTEA
jgi:hypothetical protein